MKRLVMEHKHFLMRAINLILLIGILIAYQNIASVKAREAAKIEAKNQEILAEAAAGAYKDGTYDGSGTGFGGEIKVEVTIKDGNMTKIEVLSHSGEDDQYYSNAVKLLDTMIDSQTAEVDTVSGATYSSKGLIEAVSNALEEAQ